MNRLKPVQQIIKQGLIAYCPNMYIYCGQVVNSTPDIIDEMIKILITKLNILFRQEFELKLEGNVE